MSAREFTQDSVKGLVPAPLGCMARCTSDDARALPCDCPVCAAILKQKVVSLANVKVIEGTEEMDTS